MDRGKEYLVKIAQEGGYISHSNTTLYLLLRFHLRSNGADRGPDSGMR
jgi:hypothetical protein